MHIPDKTFNIAGLMSGTSLDGLDIAVCAFTYTKNAWKYKTLAAETIDYSDGFRQSLTDAMTLSGEELVILDRAFGKYQGDMLRTFLTKHYLSVDLVSAHGHTIFHDPQKGYTFQIGNGAALHAACGIPVVTDLRSLDIALGGQGAPLVPLGDELLFSQYGACLNLGGIANIGFIQDGKNRAFDICAVNIVLNALSLKAGQAYDDGGKLARLGTVIDGLLWELNALDFYSQPGPKSLGREWVDEVVFPLITKYEDHSIHDLLCTYTTHVAEQIGLAVKGIAPGAKRTMLITGGGAFNDFLMEQLKRITSDTIQIVIPDRNTIQYKEAIIFGLLGLLRMLNIPNTKSTVTGALHDSVSGAVYGDFSAFYEV
ncbi:MAG: anhydro-N-acetylmuramic acid kinase [Cytophagales bacterium]|nr:anhydro-N-acetylmuramic acid kinase [Cytophaga sp.]